MPHPTSDDTGERLRVHRLAADVAGDDFAGDVRRGLTAARKFLLPKYFYDELGSQLFDAICLLPEYYLTRAESEIFARRADEIVELAARGNQLTLVELGSGSATKTRRIVASLLNRQSKLNYVSVDISPAALEAGAHALIKDFPALEVTAYAGDYDAALPRIPENFEKQGRALVLFLGSNVGNFDRKEANDFLRRLRGVLRAGDAVLLGADLKKDRAALEAAYDDALGVTAAFNLNALARINRELRSGFFHTRLPARRALQRAGRARRDAPSERARAGCSHRGARPNRELRRGRAHSHRELPQVRSCGAFPPCCRDRLQVGAHMARPRRAI